MENPAANPRWRDVFIPKWKPQSTIPVGMRLVMAVAIFSTLVQMDNDDNILSRICFFPFSSHYACSFLSTLWWIIIISGVWATIWGPAYPIIKIGLTVTLLADFGMILWHRIFSNTLAVNYLPFVWHWICDTLAVDHSPLVPHGIASNSSVDHWPSGWHWISNTQAVAIDYWPSIWHWISSTLAVAVNHWPSVWRWISNTLALAVDHWQPSCPDFLLIPTGLCAISLFGLGLVMLLGGFRCQAVKESLELLEHLLEMGLLSARSRSPWEIKSGPSVA